MQFVHISNRQLVSGSYLNFGCRNYICSWIFKFLWAFSKIRLKWKQIICDTRWNPTYLWGIILKCQLFKIFPVFFQLEMLTVIVKACNTFTLLYWKIYTCIIFIWKNNHILSRLSVIKKRWLFLCPSGPDTIFYPN